MSISKSYYDGYAKAVEKVAKLLSDDVQTSLASGLASTAGSLLHPFVGDIAGAGTAYALGPDDKKKDVFNSQGMAQLINMPVGMLLAKQGPYGRAAGAISSGLASGLGTYHGLTKKKKTEQ